MKSRSSSKIKAKKKEKGGRKARERRKLEKQWGEVDRNENDDRKSRLRGAANKKRNRVSSKKEKEDEEEPIDEEFLQQPETSQIQGTEDSSDEEDDQVGTTNERDVLPSLLARIKNGNRSNQSRGNDNFSFFTKHLPVGAEGKEQVSKNVTMKRDDEHNDGRAVSPSVPTKKSSSNTKPKTKIERYDPYTFRFSEQSKPMNQERSSQLLTFSMPSASDSSHSEILVSGGSLSDRLQLCVAGRECEKEDNGATSDSDALPNLLDQRELEDESESLFEYVYPGIVSRCQDVLSSACSKNKLLHKWKASLHLSLAMYADIFLPNMDSISKNETSKNGRISGDWEYIFSLHLLNHILTARNRVQKHDKIVRKQEQQQEQDGNVKEEDDDNKMRDQGYTRCKALVVLPTRGLCFSFVRKMLKLLGEGNDEEDVQFSHLERFQEEYGAPSKSDNEKSDDDSEDEDSDGENSEKQRIRRNKQREKRIMEAKGPEWQALFGENVNDSDDFKLGISFGIPLNAASSSSASAKKRKRRPKGGEGKSDPKLYVNFYSDFYKSDIILASPMGLVAATNDFASIDFLSSIEICWIGHADVLLMQNWDHVIKTLEALNQQPTNHVEYETDFSRVRNYFLDGQAREYRQLILTSRMNDPLFMASFKKHAKSLAGSMQVRQRFSEEEASMSRVEAYSGITQIFQKVHSPSFIAQGESRIKYFSNHIIPHISRWNQKHILVFVPSYFDYVLLRNMLLENQFKRDAISFVTINEYTESSDVKKARSRFLRGKKRMLLYTGRAHYFMRQRIRGIRHLIFFGLPEHAEFYADLVNMMLIPSDADDAQEEVEDAEKTCLALFTKYDSLLLERIVGSKNCKDMIEDDNTKFVFS